MGLFDKLDGKGKWAFSPWIGVFATLLFIIGFSVARIWHGVDPVTNNTIALTGAVMICLGAFTVARPVIRVGGYRAWHEKSQVIDCGHITPTDEEIAESEQLLLDSKAVNLTGPALVIAGTLINGVSGLLPFS
ncbi:MAG: hypothetical protein ACYC10_15110 [Allorhizobium sp.]